jgi:hypothetical protein
MVVVCVAGMHRSGTSMTTSWLERCGLPMTFGGAIGPDVGNRRGHFEDREVAALHRDAMLRIASDSAGWRFTELGQLSWNDDERQRAAAIVAKRAELAIWGWKDPRGTFFLDEWKALVPDFRAVLLWRPLDVVIESLRVRAERSSNEQVRITPEEAADVWRAYCGESIAWARSHPDAAMLIEARTIVTDDRGAFDAIQALASGRLRYQSIAGVLAAGEMHLGEVHGESDSLEATLRAASLAPCLASVSEQLLAPPNRRQRMERSRYDAEVALRSGARRIKRRFKRLMRAT